MFFPQTSENHYEVRESVQAIVNSRRKGRQNKRTLHGSLA